MQPIELESEPPLQQRVLFQSCRARLSSERFGDEEPREQIVDAPAIDGKTAAYVRRQSRELGLIVRAGNFRPTIFDKDLV